MTTDSLAGATTRAAGGQSVRKGPGESESGQHAVVKAGQGGDLAARDGEHQQPVRVGDPGPRVADVKAERGLAVGPGRYQPVAAALPDRRQEPARQLAALVLQRKRWHGQPDIVGEQGNDIINVAALEGPGEPL